MRQWRRVRAILFDYGPEGYSEFKFHRDRLGHVVDIYDYEKLHQENQENLFLIDSLLKQITVLADRLGEGK